MRLIGLDPGLRHTGWGVIDCRGNRLSHVADGVVHSDSKAPLAERLVTLFRGINAVLEAWKPDEAAVEETFVNKNPASTLKLGVARGVVLLAPAEKGLPCAEYSPNLVKKSVVGSGHAEKEQIAMMVRRLLPGATLASPDAADALAVAICHAHHAQTRRLWTATPGAGGGGAMIAKLTGLIDRIGPDGVVLDVNGVGYLVFCSAMTQRALPGPGEAARLLVETHVREDHIHLYGFVSEGERAAFRLLMTVQGVGARLALALLSVLSPDALAEAIRTGDLAMLAQAEGVGRKLAARIANELAEKVGGLGTEAAALRPGAAVPAGAGAAGDAVSALVNLGYRRPDAAAAVARAAKTLGDGAALDALIRSGLKELAS